MEQKIEDIIKRSLKEELQPYELELLRTWLEKDEKNPLLLEELKNIFLAEDAVRSMQQFQTENALHRILSLPQTDDSRQIKQPFVQITWVRVLVAASVLFILGFNSYYWWQKRHRSMITVHVPFGERKKIILEDKTVVWLNSGSDFSYPGNFSANSRNVDLKEGEAFFEVTRDTTRPFLINTTGFEVKVLGTSFNIQAYRSDSLSNVGVSTGKVRVRNTQPDRPNQILTLLPGEKAYAKSSDKLIHKGVVDMTKISAWREDRLIFDNESLAKVFATLERTYNKKINIENRSMLSEKVTMELKQQDIEDVLSALSFSIHFKFEIDENTITIH